MRSCDVIGIIVATRRHVGGILSENENRAKMRKSEILMPMLFPTVVFDWRIIPHTQQYAHIRNFTMLHCRNKYTSNMAAITVLGIMM